MGKANPRHHWIPKHLLEGFSHNGQTVLQYDIKQGREPNPMSIADACSSTKAFSKDVEGLMNTLESPGSWVVKFMRVMDAPVTIDPIAKRMMAFYFAPFMWYRVPGGRAAALSEIEESLHRDWASTPPRKTHGDGDDSLEYREAVQRALAEVGGDPDRFFSKQWYPMNLARWFMYSMSWRVVVSAKPVFKLPDCALVFADSATDTVYVPLSATRALAMGWRGPQAVVGVERGKTATLRRISRGCSQSARRYLYGPDPDRANDAPAAWPVMERPKMPFKEGWVFENRVAPQTRAIARSLASNKSGELEDGICMAPHPDDFTHRWDGQGVDPATGLETFICRWCGAVRLRDQEGRYEHDDMELRRRQPDMGMHNWWEGYGLKASAKGIRGVVSLKQNRISATTIVTPSGHDEPLDQW